MSAAHDTAASTGLADRLRGATRALHARAERSGIMPELLRGQLERPAYCRLLRNLHALYAALEAGLARHATHPQLATIDDPRLARTASLAADLAALHGPDWEREVGMADAGIAYVRRLQALAADDPPLLAAHAYVRYLGDLSGGQLLCAIVRQAMNLGDREGTAFYRFDTDNVAALAQRLRSGLDAIPLDAATAGRIVAEAQDAFGSHVRLFEELAASNRRRKLYC
jgi:heme oxygenase